MQFRKARGVTTAIAMTFGLSQLGLSGVMAQRGKVTPSSQSGSVAGATQAVGGTTTVLVPQDQVVYETVCDVEYVQVPTTQIQTHYKTEYRSQTVPVTRVPVQVPVTVMTTQQKQVTENVTQQYAVNVPVQVPATVMTTQQKQVTDNVTQQYAVIVPVQVPVTVMTVSKSR